MKGHHQLDIETEMPPSILSRVLLVKYETITLS